MSFDRLNPSAIRERLRSIGAFANKELGQHFLVDSTVLDAIVEAAGVSAEDTVVEVGPGPGVLTERLLAAAKRVVAFEFDPWMQSILMQDFPQLELHGGDVLRTAPPVLPDLGAYKVVANIPYQITNPLLRLFLETESKPTALTLLIQKEVAQRLAAEPKTGERGYMSVLAQYFAEVRYVRMVPPKSFWPAPKVDSAVVHLVVRPERPLAPEQEADFFHFVHRFFTQQRKQLKNVVAGIRGISAAEVVEQFARLGLPETVRAQELSVEQWISLYKENL